MFVFRVGRWGCRCLPVRYADMCPHVRLSAPACLCDISPTRGMPRLVVGGRGRLVSRDVFTLFAGWVGCCLGAGFVRRIVKVIRVGGGQRNGYPRLGDSPHDPHLPSLPASPPAGALVHFPCRRHLRRNSSTLLSPTVPVPTEGRRSQF